jgi:hypothetical protein
MVPDKYSPKIVILCLALKLQHVNKGKAEDFVYFLFRFVSYSVKLIEHVLKVIFVETSQPQQMIFEYVST